MLRQMRQTASLPGLVRTQIQATVFEELSMMPKASEISGFGEDGQRQISPTPGKVRRR